MLKITHKHILDKTDIGVTFLIGILLAKTSLEAIQGNFKGSWGYGEFLINYSGGYVRRGLSGALLQLIDGIWSGKSYLITVVVVSIIIWANFLMSIKLIRILFPSPLVRIYIQLNATMFLFIFFNPNVYIRKDHLIIFGLLLHTLVAEKLKRKTITKATYEKFIWVLIGSLIIIGQMHEIQALFIPVHMLIFLNITKTLSINKISKVISMFAVMVGTLLISAILRGTKRQVQSIISSIPENEKYEPGAIKALGWSSREAMELSTLMFNSVPTLLCFGIVLIVGPITIGVITNQFRLTNLFWKKVVVISPLALLFILGWDWGRWLNLLTITILCLAAIGGAKQPKIISKFHAVPILSLILVIIFSVIWRNPECCTRAPEEAFLNFMNFIHYFGLELTPN